MYLYGLITYVFFALNSISLYGCATVYPSTHLLKDFLVVQFRPGRRHLTSLRRQQTSHPDPPPGNRNENKRCDMRLGLP